MKLTAEQLQENWSYLMSYIDNYIEEPRRTKLKEFYNKYQEQLMFLPASHKDVYHSAFIGGYIYHVLNVLKASLKINNVWKDMGVDDSTYTVEELIFSALNHDLGKMGDGNEVSYLPQTDKWRKEKLGEEWMFNTKLAFASVPDRSLFLLQSHGIQYSFNEMIAIQTHDGLYDEANKKYLMGFMSEQKPRTSLPFILHQADLMSARIEWEQQWLTNFQSNLDLSKEGTTLGDKQSSGKLSSQQKALGSVKSEGLKNAMANFFDVKN